MKFQFITLNKNMSQENIPASLNGRSITYTSSTVFTIELGHGKGSYTKRVSFIGDLQSAVRHYNSINIGKGHKKRFKMGSTILARSSS